MPFQSKSESAPPTKPNPLRLTNVEAKPVAPWDRRPDLGQNGNGETALMYRRFVIYRDLGPSRTHQALVSKLIENGNPDKHPTDLHVYQKYASINKWTERCEAWDTEQEKLTATLHLAAMDRAARELFTERRKKMEAQFFAEGEALHTIAKACQRRISKFLIAETPIPAASMPAFINATVALSKASAEMYLLATAVEDLSAALLANEEEE